MAINKVVYGNDTLVDLTNDTVEANNLLEGETAHDRSGNLVTGTAKQGHVVQDASGTAVTQEPTMQFTDSHVSDDSTNEKTKVEVIKSVASADYSLETEDGLYLIPDGDGSIIEPESEDYVEVTADGTKTYATLYNELFALVDESKITVDAILEQNGVAFSRAGYVPNSEIEFSYSAIGYQKPYIEMIRLKPSNSIIYRYSNDTFSDISSSVPTNGKKITLHYGNKKAVVDLQTTANRCWLPNGATVSDTVDISGLMTPQLNAGASFKAIRNVNTISISFYGTMSTNASAVIKNIPSFMQGNETYICGYVYDGSTYYPLIRYGSNLYCDHTFPSGTTVWGNATMIV